ncbi:Phage late control gene D protein (GPD) [Pseudarcicella hirudinis]|uniref:Phage late control gene D protein (GPD) n=1 Tax=Pseudarcicella hirudinis TaxID=1079859 RepID=A0A1I5MVV9_9BACT|nr:hypothetical protein [Pseudarcicella hirudinis]SFP13735.1 Phage late control gene D protein (GPD) [Pseudarcicella hirudinis]
MLEITHDIRIANVRLRSFSAIEINKSIEQLSGTCVIELPAMLQNLPYNIEGKVKRGDIATVSLGYDGKNRQEFTGYLRAISPNTPMRLEFEDSMFLLRKQVKNKSYTNVDISTLIKDIVNQIGGFTFNISVQGIRFEKYVIRDQTAYQVLEKLKQDTNINIFCVGTELNAHLLYTQKTGEVNFYTHNNMRKDTNLQYVRADQVNISITAIGKTKNRNKIEKTVGTLGGDNKVMRFPDISDPATLQKLAEESLKRYSYDGYRGEIKTWGHSTVAVGNTAKIVNELYPQQNGSYYVIAVKVEVKGGQVGFCKTASLGLKVS